MGFRLLLVQTGILLLFLTSCEEVRFEQTLTSDSTATSVSPDDFDDGFDDDGIYIDNSTFGARVINIANPVEPSAIGEEGERVGGQVTCVNYDDSRACYNNTNSQVFVGDSFEREDVAPLNNNIFSWRTIINDNGRIIDGTAANNVELKSYDSSVLGEAADGQRSLYFTGRAGKGSVHSLYLVTKAFDLSETNGIVYFSFKYLPLGLERGEFFRLEICNNSLENCGVGSTLSVDGLQSRNWLSIFESNGSEVNSNLTGLNHTRSDWVTKQMAVRLDGFQRSQFVFRLHAYMDEGFYNNNFRQGVDDAIGVDDFRVFSFFK